MPSLRIAPRRCARRSRLQPTIIPICSMRCANSPWRSAGRDQSFKTGLASEEKCRPDRRRIPSFKRRKQTGGTHGAWCPPRRTGVHGFERGSGSQGGPFRRHKTRDRRRGPRLSAPSAPPADGARRTFAAQGRNRRAAPAVELGAPPSHVSIRSNPHVPASRRAGGCRSVARCRSSSTGRSRAPCRRVRLERRSQAASGASRCRCTPRRLRRCPAGNLARPAGRGMYAVADPIPQTAPPTTAAHCRRRASRSGISRQQIHQRGSNHEQHR